MKEYPDQHPPKPQPACCCCLLQESQAAHPATQPPYTTAPPVPVARPLSRLSSSARLGGATNTKRALSPEARTCGQQQQQQGRGAGSSRDGSGGGWRQQPWPRGRSGRASGPPMPPSPPLTAPEDAAPAPQPPQPHLPRALHVDVEHAAAAAVSDVAHRLHRGAVNVLVHVRVLQEAARRDALLKLLPRGEVVVDAVLQRRRRQERREQRCRTRGR